MIVVSAAQYCPSLVSCQKCLQYYMLCIKKLGRKALCVVIVNADFSLTKTGYRTLFKCWQPHICYCKCYFLVFFLQCRALTLAVFQGPRTWVCAVLLNYCCLNAEQRNPTGCRYRKYNDDRILWSVSEQAVTYRIVLKDFQCLFEIDKIPAFPDIICCVFHLQQIA